MTPLEKDDKLSESESSDSNPELENETIRTAKKEVEIPSKITLIQQRWSPWKATKGVKFSD
eukprot:10285860-Ditylum_brightwellii.AAC.1